MKKGRGVFLTLLLVGQGLNIPYLLYTLLNPGYTTPAYGGVLPSWFMIYTLLQLVLSTTSLIGLLQWRKWGVYAFFASLLLPLFLELFRLTPINKGSESFNNFVIFMYLILLAIFIWILRRKWKYFS